MKLNELEEKNNELLNIRGTLKGANTDIEEKTKQIEVFSDNFPTYFVLIYYILFVSPTKFPCVNRSWPGIVGAMLSS